MLNLFQITSLNTDSFKDNKAAYLVEIHNVVAKHLGLKVVKKFKDKTTTITRTIAVIDAYRATLPKPEIKSFETETYQISGNPPKHAESAMGLLYDLVSDDGIVSYKELAAEFIRIYSPIYKGVKDINMSFARGYIKGALRAGHLIIKK